MASIKESVFTGTDNTFTINVSDENREALELNSITSMKLWLGSACNYLIDSTLYPNAFNWTTPENGDVGDVEFSLGFSVEDLQIPAGNYVSRWKIYTVTATNGIIIVDKSSKTKLQIKVLASCEAV